MVVAADDGVMPQTREHCGGAAGARRRRPGSSRSPRPTSPTGARPRRGALGAAEVVPVSARTGEGLDDLRAALDRAAASAASRSAAGGPLRLHVDRAFTVHGAGTVVTGTLWSGVARRGDEVVAAAARAARPGARRAGPRRARGRGAGRPARRAQPRRGRRDEVARGDVVVSGAGGPEPPTAWTRAWTGRTRATAPASWSTTARARRPRAPSPRRRRLAAAPGGADRAAAPATGSSCAPSRRRTRSAAGWSWILAAAAIRRLPAAAPPVEGPRPPRRPGRSTPEPAAAAGVGARDGGAAALAEPAAGRRAPRGRPRRAARPRPRRARRPEPCTSTPTSSPSSARASSRCSRPRARSRSAASATSSAPPARYVQALLEHLDAERLTLRRGDVRVLRRRRA